MFSILQNLRPFLAETDSTLTSIISVGRKIHQAAMLIKGIAGLVEISPENFPTDIKRFNSTYSIIVNIPGVTYCDVEVEEGNVISISGVRRSTDETQGMYVLQERKTGRFLKKIPLPDDADPYGDPGRAYADGVLTLTQNVIPRAVN